MFWIIWFEESELFRTQDVAQVTEFERRGYKVTRGGEI